MVNHLVFNKLLPMWDGEVSEGVELTIESRVATEDATIGCSIAVNGVCLTATNLVDNKVPRCSCHYSLCVTHVYLITHYLMCIVHS